MIRRSAFVATIATMFVAASAGPSFAQRGQGAPVAGPTEQLDLAAYAKIRSEGFDRSKVMEISSWLTDVYGPRLTGSPNAKKAGDWTIEAMRSWGITNPRYEWWTAFGHSWVNEGFTAQVVAPTAYPIVAYPTPWSFGTPGTVTGEVAINVRIDSAADFAKYRGKLRGKWVMVGQPVAVNPKFAGVACRFDNGQLAIAANLARSPNCRTSADSQWAVYDRQQLAAAANAGAPGGRGGAGAPGGRGGGRGGAGGMTAQQLTDFYVSEGVLGTLRGGSGNYTDFVVSVSGGRVAEIPKAGVTNVAIAADHFGRIYRTVEKGVPVRVEINAKSRFTPDTGSFNIIGEIPGTDPALRNEVVMLGAHFDSWTGGTGATDNAAGSAVMLEAMRILKTLNLPMKRTVRIGLWTGEEQGLIGSAQYVRKQFGYVDSTGQHFTPEYNGLAGYFNVDNGTGAIRGVYVERNEAIAPIFKQWLEPFRDLGATTITLSTTGGTDHQSYDRIGLAGFQFIQDEVDYGSATHHTNADVYERLVPRDMMLNSVIVATFVYNTANRDEKLPRKPAPTGRGGGRGGRGGN